MSFFSVNALSAGYGKENIIDNISFQLDNGSLTGILGANGCGKTTLLKSLCGILPHQGSCLLEGTSLEKCTARKLAQLCSYIPQRSGISIDISVLDVVLMGFNPHLKLLGHPNHLMKEKAMSMLHLVGLSGKEHCNYLHLSEGQKQLCILARTLVSDSKLLLLDEPESALDFRFRYHMLGLLRSWVNNHSRAAIVTLHDPTLALNYCDQLLLMKDKDIIGTIYPASDTIRHMEQLLCQIYGDISLHPCNSKDGNSHLIMLKEEIQ